MDSFSKAAQLCLLNLGRKAPRKRVVIIAAADWGPGSACLTAKLARHVSRYFPHLIYPLADSQRAVHINRRQG